MKEKFNLKQIINTEASFNFNLYILCGFITLVTMAMIVTEFFSRGQFFPNHISFFYLGILVIYALHKELVRWLGRRKIERQGEYFVYAWILLTTFLYIINFVSKDYYVHLVRGGPSSALRDVSILTLEVLAVFILTRGLKVAKLLVRKKNIKL
ncbi:hypothetical protein KKC00_02960 [Patescibacteria group bacterium]|nr:hypothetical protein [Patescibacteria group bacterium]